MIKMLAWFASSLRRGSWSFCGSLTGPSMTVQVIGDKRGVRVELEIGNDLAERWETA
jgi:hypothetical protein